MGGEDFNISENNIISVNTAKVDSSVGGLLNFFHHHQVGYFSEKIGCLSGYQYQYQKVLNVVEVINTLRIIINGYT